MLTKKSKSHRCIMRRFQHRQCNNIAKMLTKIESRSFVVLCSLPRGSVQSFAVFLQVLCIILWSSEVLCGLMWSFWRSCAVLCGPVRCLLLPVGMCMRTRLLQKSGWSRQRLAARKQRRRGEELRDGHVVIPWCSISPGRKWTDGTVKTCRAAYGQHSLLPRITVHRYLIVN